jgi:hypothetical protein
MVQTITTAETETRTGIMAQNILTKAFGLEFEHAILKIPEEPQQRKGYFEQDTVSKTLITEEGKFRIYPNPKKKRCREATLLEIIYFEKLCGSSGFHFV